MAAIYAIGCDKKNGALTVKTTWEDSTASSSLVSGSTGFCSIEAYGRNLLVGTCPEKKRLDIYDVSAGGTELEDKGWLEVKLAYTTVSGFSVAGVPHVVAYEPKAGTFEFFHVARDLTLKSVYSYSKTYGSVTTDFTTVEAYEYQGEMLLLGYNSANGDVKVYRLQVTAFEPLTMRCVWSKDWSPGWVRFSFFKLGKENFFLKSNIRHKTVYIDHVNDDASTGSRPVGRHLPLPLDLSIVQTFEVAGCVRFMAYRESGEAVINRLHTDCQGWTEELMFTAKDHAVCAVPLSQGEECFLFMY
ncbi:MAG: hypothetical protein R6X15_06415 [Pseudomonadota bacterium]